jgi:hypothetical protein
MKLFASALLICLFSLELSAMTNRCAEEVWVQVPGVNNGVFTGKLAVDCRFDEVNAGDLEKLTRYFEDQTADSAHVLHSGPVKDESLGFKGVKYDLTAKLEEGLMRSTIRIAGDSEKNFRYVSDSSEISFSGFAKFLRKLKTEIYITKIDQDSYKLTMINLTEVNKPSYAPTEIFNSMAQKNSKKVFRQNLLKLVDEVSNNL